MLPRLAGALLSRALGVSPAVVVMGARQTGKSTLVRTHPDVRARPYFTLDDLDVREQAVDDPDALLGRAPLLTLDEVQRQPALILAIKRAIDADRPRRPGRFVLTGSANLLLMRRVSETLAGRATYVGLWPLTRRERLGRGRGGVWPELFTAAPAEWYDLMRGGEPIPARWREEVRLGGYPTPAYELADDEARRLWFAGYVQTYLERDLQDLAAIESLVDFHRLMRAACLRMGNLVNQAELARDTGIPGPTVHRYLNLLETSFQLVRLEPYAVNRTKRLIKSPKLYWSDTALALFLGAQDEPQGAHLENMVLTDLLAWRDAEARRPQVLYWRTASGQEVDFVLEHAGRLLAIEVKASARPTHHDAQNLLVFRSEYGSRVHGALLLHDGEEVSWIAPGVLAAPWWRVL